MACLGAGGGALQVQRNAEVDQLLGSQLREAKGGREVEELPRLPGAYSCVAVFLLSRRARMICRHPSTAGQMVAL